MGKAKRLKEQRRKSKKQVVSNNFEFKWRRLAWLGIATVAAGLWAANLYYNRDNTEPFDTVATEESTSNTIEEVVEVDPWNFLAKAFELESNNVSYVKSITVPFGPSDEIQRGSWEYDEIMPRSYPGRQNIAQQAGIPLNEFDLELKRQMRMVPLSEEYRETFISYCKLAEEFLHENITGLKQEKVDWVNMLPGDDYAATNIHRKGFLGDYKIRFYETTMSHNGSPIGFTRSFAGNVGGQAFTEVKPEDGKLIEWYFCIARSPGVLTTPFSEILPISLEEVAFEYMDNSDPSVPGRVTNISYKRAHLAMEALSEGMALLLGEQIVEELEIPNGELSLAEHNRVMTDPNRNPMYELVPEAIVWMEEHSAQEAFDLYQNQGVEAFLGAIQN